MAGGQPQEMLVKQGALHYNEIHKKKRSKAQVTAEGPYFTGGRR